MHYTCGVFVHLEDFYSFILLRYEIIQIVVGSILYFVCGRQKRNYFVNVLWCFYCIVCGVLFPPFVKRDIHIVSNVF